MTVLPVTRDQISGQFREAARLLASGLAWLLFAIGWLLVKSLRAVGMLIGGVFFGVGWFGARAVWPALLWAGAAVKLGWQEGRKPGLRPGVG